MMYIRYFKEADKTEEFPNGEKDLFWIKGTFEELIVGINKEMQIEERSASGSSRARCLMVSRDLSIQSNIGLGPQNTWDWIDSCETFRTPLKGLSDLKDYKANYAPSGFFANAKSLVYVARSAG